MTKVIATNSAHDMYMDDTNNIVIATGQKAIELAAQTASLAQLGEMIFFTTQGIPAFKTVFNGTPNYSLYSAAVIAAIESIEGVVAVTSFDVSAQGGTMAYTATIETKYGATVING